MKLTNVEKKLGRFSLNIDSLALSMPGIYGLIGPNGSGKSTLAKLMTGLLEADNGIIDCEGLGARDITYLGRKPYMTDDTVYNNLVYPLKLRNIKPDLNLITAFLDRMKFSLFLKQKAGSLSGGEQQKLALLRAVIFSPRFVIMDEAMTAIDIDSLHLFEQLILEEQKKNNSIWIIISHQMPHIRRICDYLFFMYNGRIEAEGSDGDLFFNVRNSHIKQYLRSYYK
ncbi:MAG: ABC transporter ATP-binding protein [Treponema sp.]|nr:ABC transporter ATP-binding protein [Treponema sp.]